MISELLLHRYILICCGARRPAAPAPTWAPTINRHEGQDTLWLPGDFKRLFEDRVASPAQVIGCYLHGNVGRNSDAFELRAVGKRMVDRCDVNMP
jgi:hypothetical protein